MERVRISFKRTSKRAGDSERPAQVADSENHS